MGVGMSVEVKARTFYDRPYNTLDVRDIVSQNAPSSKHFNAGLPRNPLTPFYQLPSPAKPLTYEQPRFLRNTLVADDIAFAYPFNRIDLIQTRSSQFDISDISGAKPKQRTKSRAKGQNLNQLDVQDITKPSFRTKRETNPLSPR